MTQKVTRLDWVDELKAFGLALVFLGHCFIPRVDATVYMFHMPLFFILSGYVYNKVKYDKLTISSFVAIKAKSYLIPYVKVGVISFIIWGIVWEAYHCGFTVVYVKKLIRYAYYLVISEGNNMPNCCPIWFLMSLFFVEVIFHSVSKNKYGKWMIVLFGVLGGAFANRVRLPFNLDNAFTALPLFLGGYALRHWGGEIFHKKNILFLLGGISAILLYLEYRYNYIRVDFNPNEFSNFPLMYITSSIISLFLILLFYHVNASNFSKNSRMEKKLKDGILIIGRNTLYLFSYNYSFITIARIIGFEVGTWSEFIAVSIIGLSSLFILENNKKLKQLVI